MIRTIFSLLCKHLVCSSCGSRLPEMLPSDVLDLGNVTDGDVSPA